MFLSVVSLCSNKLGSTEDTTISLRAMKMMMRNRIISEQKHNYYRILLLLFKQAEISIVTATTIKITTTDSTRSK